MALKATGLAKKFCAGEGIDTPDATCRFVPPPYGDRAASMPGLEYSIGTIRYRYAMACSPTK